MDEQKELKFLILLKNNELEFGYIRAAASYLIINGFTDAKKVDSVMNRLSVCAKRNKKYKNRFCVEFVG